MSVIELDPIEKTKEKKEPEKSWNVILQNAARSDQHCVACILTMAFSMSLKKARSHAEEARKTGRSIILSDLPSKKVADQHVVDATSHFQNVCSPPIAIGFKAEPQM